MTFGPGNVVPMAENAAAAIVKRAVEDAPPAVSRAALGEALVRAGLLLLEQECGHVEATRVAGERNRWKERAFSAEDTVRQLEQKCDDLEAENDLLTVKLAVRREFAANSKDTVRRLEKKLAELEAEIVEYAE